MDTSRVTASLSTVSLSIRLSILCILALVLLSCFGCSTFPRAPVMVVVHSDRHLRGLRLDVPRAWTLAFSPLDHRLAVGLESGKVEILDVDTHERRLELMGLDNVINAVAWSPDGTLIAAASGVQSMGKCEGCRVAVWNAASGELLRTFDTSHEGPPQNLIFAPKGKLLLWVCVRMSKEPALATLEAADLDTDKHAVDISHYLSGSEAIVFVNPTVFIWRNALYSFEWLPALTINKKLEFPDQLTVECVLQNTGYGITTFDTDSDINPGKHSWPFLAKTNLATGKVELLWKLRWDQGNLAFRNVTRSSVNEHIGVAATPCSFVFDAATGQHLADLVSENEECISARQISYSYDGKYLAGTDVTNVYLWTIGGN